MLAAEEDADEAAAQAAREAHVQEVLGGMKPLSIRKELRERGLPTNGSREEQYEVGSGGGEGARWGGGRGERLLPRVCLRTVVGVALAVSGGGRQVTENQPDAL